MYLSVFGNSFATIEIRNGMPTLTLCEPNFLNREGKSFVETELAVVWKRITLDNYSVPIKEV